MKCLLFLAFFVAFATVQSSKPYKSPEELYAKMEEVHKKMEYFYRDYYEKEIIKLLDSGLPYEHYKVKELVRLYILLIYSQHKKMFHPSPDQLSGMNPESQDWDLISDLMNDYEKKVDKVYNERKNKEH